MRTLEGTMHTNIPSGSTPETTPATPTHRFRRLSVVAGAGLLAGLIAAAIGGVASAQTTGTTVLTEVDPSAAHVRVMQFDEAEDGDGPIEFDMEGDMEISPEDEAIWDEFDQCLVDAGVDFEALEAAEESGDDAALDESAIDIDALDAAFEACEPVLENLSEDFEIFDVSAEDDAVFEQFDECLVQNGVDFEVMEAVDGDDPLEDGGTVEVYEGDEDAIDAAFEACEPILENLSDELQAEMDEFEMSEFEMSEFDGDELWCDTDELDGDEDLDDE